MGPDTVKTDSGYFVDLGRRLSSLSEDCQRQVMRHVDYLADKAGIRACHILDGSPFNVQQAMLSDAIHNIENEIASTDAIAEPSHERLNSTIRKSAALPGWCSIEKASLIAELVRAERPDTCVEIGIYGGRSLVPCAAALRENGRGVIYGIETWCPVAATAYITSEEHDDWWRNVDYARIKVDFLRFIVDKDLVNWVRLLEAPSAQVANLFASIDYLHIDGAHSVLNAAEDVALYLKRLRSGGSSSWMTSTGTPLLRPMQSFRRSAIRST